MPAFAFSVPLPNAAIRCERGFFFGVAVQGAVEKFVPVFVKISLREDNTGERTDSSIWQSRRQGGQTGASLVKLASSAFRQPQNYVQRWAVVQWVGMRACGAGRCRTSRPLS